MIIIFFLILDISLLVLSVYFAIKTKWLLLVITVVCFFLLLRVTTLFMLTYSYWIISTRFWKFARKKPEEFINFFRARENIWKVFDSELSKNIFDKLYKDNPDDKWVGPFVLRIPATKKFVYIYGRDGLYQQEQEQMVRIINKSNNK
jgi:hypothetical protein